uniref:Uncharacterized protein n=1 Tax=Magallana gigas TaxID=29159 RepID=K1Q492_MAGGI
MATTIDPLQKKRDLLLVNVHTEANESVGNVRVDLGAHTLLPVELKTTPDKVKTHAHTLCSGIFRRGIKEAASPETTFTFKIPGHPV